MADDFREESCPPGASRHRYLIVPWAATLFVLATFAIGGICLIRASREQEKVTRAMIEHLEQVDASLRSIADSSRRAHLRLDTTQRQLGAITEQLGWSDDHAHTKLLTIPLDRRLPPEASKLETSAPSDPSNRSSSQAVTLPPSAAAAEALEKTLLDLRPVR